MGKTIRVRPIPPHLAQAAMAAVVLPKPPIREIKSGIGNAVEKREEPNDPKYREEWDRALNERGRVLVDFQYAWGIEVDLPPTDSWKQELEQDLPFPIEWGEGPRGEKADYIRYVLLQFPSDHDLVHKALRGEEDPIKPEEVKSLQDSFRGQEEGSRSL